MATVNHQRPTRLYASMSRALNLLGDKLSRKARARSSRSTGDKVPGSKAAFRHTIASLFMLRRFALADNWNR